MYRRIKYSRNNDLISNSNLWSPYDDDIKKIQDDINFLLELKEDSISEIRKNPDADPEYFGNNLSDIYEDWFDLDIDEKIAIIENLYFNDLKKLEDKLSILESERDKWFEEKTPSIKDSSLVDLVKNDVEIILKEFNLPYQRKDSPHEGKSSYFYVSGYGERYDEELGKYVPIGEGFVIRVSDHEPSLMYTGLHHKPDFSYVVGYDDDLNPVVFYGRRFNKYIPLAQFADFFRKELVEFLEEQEEDF